MFASVMLVAGIKEGKTTFTRTVSTEDLDEYRWLEQLLDLEVDVIVCGGISPEIAKLLGSYGIQVICNVAGEAREVLETFASGGLHPWFGYFPRKKQEGEAGHGMELEAARHKQACEARLVCEAWMRPAIDLNGKTGASPDSLYEMSLTPVGDVSEIAGIVRQNNYKRIGLAYCAELSKRVPAMVEALKQAAEVYPLVCPARCVNGHAENGNHDPAPCRPDAQAEIINNEKCDLVIVMGLCPAFHARFDSVTRARMALVLPADTAARRRRGQKTQAGA